LRWTCAPAGKYYSLFQTCTVVEEFRRTTGSSLAREPALDFEAFLRVLAFLPSFSPQADPKQGLFTKHPSYILDVVCRVAYPVVYVAKVVFFFAMRDKLYSGL